MYCTACTVPQDCSLFIQDESIDRVRYSVAVHRSVPLATVDAVNAGIIELTVGGFLLPCFDFFVAVYELLQYGKAPVSSATV